MAKREPKAERPDDLPAPGKSRDERRAERDARHARLTAMRFNGPEEWWTHATAGLGIRADSVWVAMQVFEAFDAAMDDCAVRRDHYPAALAQATNEAETVRVLRAALRAVQIAHDEAGYGPVHEAGFEPIAFATGCVPNWRFFGEVLTAYHGEAEARRDALIDRRKPSTRVRLFAERLKPVFEKIWERQSGAVPDFRTFLVASCRLVCDFEPGAVLAQSVSNELLKNGVLTASLRRVQSKWTPSRERRTVRNTPQPPTSEIAE